MRKPELIYEENESYIEQLKTFKKRGVKVLIDGVEQPESKWKELLKVSDDGGFYIHDSSWPDGEGAGVYYTEDEMQNLLDHTSRMVLFQN